MTSFGIEEIRNIRAEGVKAVGEASSLGAIEEERVRWLGRKGALTEILRGLKDAEPSERKALGKAANEVKSAITEALESRKQGLQSAQTDGESSRDRVDLTLPGRKPERGHVHVLSQVLQDIVGVFTDMGYQVASGPDIETEYYNFDALNTPKDHPARDVHDTFFVEPGVVLRTHTSPVQMRVMEKFEPPVAVVVPGRAYRVDLDASHSPMFFQVEGLLVDERVTFSDLKGTLAHFARKIFGKGTEVRFRPHFFPFTEPSAEVDVSCSVCKGSGCRLCKNSGWLEVLGCGMVHPEVFRNANYDYEKYRGFAFGMGVERVAMLRHAIPNMGLLYENDLRFLEQF